MFCVCVQQLSLSTMLKAQQGNITAAFVFIQVR